MGLSYHCFHDYMMRSVLGLYLILMMPFAWRRFTMASNMARCLAASIKPNYCSVKYIVSCENGPPTSYSIKIVLDEPITSDCDDKLNENHPYHGYVVAI
jgi:hypothetical protein